MKDTDLWESVLLYGVEHSPWVQGIRLALAHHQIPTQLTSYPLRFSWFWKYGPVFPVLQLRDSSIHIDSFHMYVLLEEHGYDVGIHNIDEEERFLLQAEMEKLFSFYALGRCGKGKNWRFHNAWSTMREVPNRVRGIVFRAWLSHYFWVLIQGGIHMVKKKNRRPYDLERIEQLLVGWNQKLEHRSWLTGDTVGFVDFAFFGHIQCMMSGLTDELVPILKRQQQLMRWVEKMLLLQEGYHPMYTQRLLGTTSVAQSTSKQRAIFWVAWFGFLFLWPCTFFVIGCALYNRRNNPARTLAVLERYRKERKP